MSNASRLPEKRMLKLEEAASYVGVSSKLFPKICRITPVQFSERSPKLWGRHGLDRWIDSFDEGFNFSEDDIVGRLG